MKKQIGPTLGLEALPILIPARFLVQIAFGFVSQCLLLHRDDRIDLKAFRMATTQSPRSVLNDESRSLAPFPTTGVNTSQSVERK